ncbi:MAG: helix-turn-helix transcriptional regulator [Rhizobiaceae bacterium]|nr:helix-turn-helix transcriptional regulator [Rhizobiaceae bacterium]
MPEISPSTLIEYRNERGFSQRQLAALAGLGIATVKRIEGSKAPYHASASAAEKLTKALQVEEGALGRPYVKPNEYVSLELTVRADVDESIGYSMVEALYGIQTLEQLMLAPLLTAMVAEQSLQWRRKRLKKMTRRVGKLATSLAGNEKVLASLDGLYAALQEERESIENRDVLGRKLSGVDMQESPLNAFIRFTTRSNGSNSIIRIDEGDGPSEIPDFWIGERQIEDLAGADGPTLFAVAMGWVRLVDFPADVRGKEKDEARLAWLRTKLTDDQYSRATRWSAVNETIYERL